MSEPQATKSAEEKLAILIRELWDYYTDGTTIEPTDIEEMLAKAELSQTYSATEDEAENIEDVEVGDDIFGLTREALDLLDKYP